MENVEFYNTPDGDVMYKMQGREVRVLRESDRDVIRDVLAIIRDRYPQAHEALMKLYSVSELNRVYFEYRVVHRFIRCNFGEYDQLHPDIDGLGRFCMEEVRCPLRGECKNEGVICRPKLFSKLTDRELEVMRLVVCDHLKSQEIADELCISPCTVQRHRDNIKAKLGLRTTADMVEWWMKNHPEGV